MREEIQKLLPEIIAFRRDVHRHPSQSGSEQETVVRITKQLDKYGVKYDVLLDGTAVCAQVGTGGEPCVGVRADIDALPITEDSGVDFASENKGCMHACGHDMHASIVLGIAILLKQHENELGGTVKFFFQPAEETTGGADRMIKAGVLENPYVKQIIGLHVEPGYLAGEAGFKYGQMMAASDEFTLRVRGKGCHGAHPDSGVDTIVLASQIVTALQSISSRNLAPYEAGVVTVGKFTAGTAGNVIPAEAELVGILRSLSEETRMRLRERVKAVAEGVAQAYGGEAELELRPSYTALTNDDTIVSVVHGAAKEVFGADKVTQEKTPSLGTEDFAYFAQARPSCFWHLGCGYEGKYNAPIHNAKFNANENCIPLGIEVQTKAILQLLKN